MARPFLDFDFFVNDFAKLIGQTITEKTRSLWVPIVKKIDMTSESYES